MIHKGGTEATAVHDHATELAAHKCVRCQGGRGGVRIVGSEPSRVMYVSGGNACAGETNKLRSIRLFH